MQLLHYEVPRSSLTAPGSLNLYAGATSDSTEVVYNRSISSHESNVVYKNVNHTFDEQTSIAAIMLWGENSRLTTLFSYLRVYSDEER